MVPTIEWKNGIVSMLDQTKLPIEVVYFDCKTYQDVAKGIKDLIIRGAPAIGVAAAMGIALGVKDIKANDFAGFYNEMEKICSHIGSTRPTAVNLFWAIERMKKVATANKEKPVNAIKDILFEESNRVLTEDIAANMAMGKHGSQFIKTGDTILTHCNAGALAT